MTAAGCASCGVSGDCPFIAEMPRGYELITDDAVLIAESPVGCCGCGGNCPAN